MPPCPHCGFANRQEELFCVGCKSPLSPICSACGAEGLVGARFCEGCGSSFTQADVPEASLAGGMVMPTGPGSVDTTGIFVWKRHCTVALSSS